MKNGYTILAKAIELESDLVHLDTTEIQDIFRYVYIAVGVDEDSVDYAIKNDFNRLR